MLGHGGSSAGSYLADPTSPIPSHCAVIILFQSVPVHQLSRLALYDGKISPTEDMISTRKVGIATAANFIWAMDIFVSTSHDIMCPNKKPIQLCSKKFQTVRGRTLMHL